MAAGIRGVEWDAVELPSQFMENWSNRCAARLRVAAAPAPVLHVSATQHGPRQTKPQTTTRSVTATSHVVCRGYAACLGPVRLRRGRYGVRAEKRSGGTGAVARPLGGPDHLASHPAHRQGPGQALMMGSASRSPIIDGLRGLRGRR